MQKIFLTAEWTNLIMANYEVDPAVLLPYLPAHTELDYFNGKAYASLVGFMFEKVKIKGISIPFHTHFPEVNLRFYVKRQTAEGIQRGVVFISEIVPKFAIAWVANNLYREKYIATRMSHTVAIENDLLRLNYSWKWKGRMNHIAATMQNMYSPIIAETKEAYIFEHYFGFAKVNASVTNQYSVEHPVWNIYPVNAYDIDCAFAVQYGASFAFLDSARPASVFVAAGSVVAIREKVVLTNG